MIDNLTISFERAGITHTLNVPTMDENLPDNLATAFAEVIKRSCANDEMVIDNLSEEFFISIRQNLGFQSMTSFQR